MLSLRNVRRAASPFVGWAAALVLGLAVVTAGCGTIGNVLRSPAGAARGKSREPDPETLRRQVEADPFPSAAKVGL